MCIGIGDQNVEDDLIKQGTALTVHQVHDQQLDIQKKCMLVGRAQAEALVFGLPPQERNSWVIWPAPIIVTFFSRQMRGSALLAWSAWSVIGNPEGGSIPTDPEFRLPLARTGRRGARRTPRSSVYRILQSGRSSLNVRWPEIIVETIDWRLMMSSRIAT